MTKILITDDSRLMRKIITGIVSEIPFLKESEIFEAEDGEQAGEILSNNNIDIILLDWNMPKLNGLEIVKKIKAKEYQSSPVIIMVTSESAKYNMIEAIESGVDHYLVKPVIKSDILEVFNKLDL